MALYDTESWTLRKVDQKYVGSFEMWCWKRMEIFWTDQVGEEEVSQRVKEERNVVHTVKTVHRVKRFWGNHIQRVKIVINDNIIEQVTDFKCLGYRISEYKRDVEDKLQTYNKINGAIRRHFVKQMNKETKLIIHNITAKAALKFGSEAWVLKKGEEQRLEAAQMKFLRHLLGITKLDKEKYQCIREKKQEQRI